MVDISGVGCERRQPIPAYFPTLTALLSAHQLDQVCSADPVSRRAVSAGKVGE